MENPGREDAAGREFNHYATPEVENFAGMELWNKTDGYDEFYYTEGYITGDGAVSSPVWIE